MAVTCVNQCSCYMLLGHCEVYSPTASERKVFAVCFVDRWIQEKALKAKGIEHKRSFSQIDLIGNPM
eukprot:6086844-Amphidinium_carterae.1